MLQLFVDNPWLVLCALASAVTVFCVGIVFVTDHLRKTHQAEIDATLKQDMLNRGMSAADIKTILEASSDGEAERLAMNQGVRVGLGKFQVEVSGASRTAESPANG